MTEPSDEMTNDALKIAGVCLLWSVCGCGNGGSCQKDIDCADGRICEAGECIEASAPDMLCVVAPGTACSTDADCCDGLCGLNPATCCARAQHDCHSNSDCCSNVCSGGKCAAGPLNSVCKDASDCAAGVTCQFFFAVEVAVCCMKDGDSCATTGDCCTGRCVGGKCDSTGCKPSLAPTAGGECSTDGDCCSGHCSPYLSTSTICGR